ncbi:acetyltransferase [Emticicia sp. C21]|uniref:acetyltransferase n=1 Tax=Emticicia sp. C21 TaxID=2302915 RepID=UPI000E34E8E3|nr:acetyltransferase [Emticicia sp. C21]RFS17230.1 acetyltransferase [Emticicia sp. C21]
MLLYGASGHAKVICSCLEACEIKITGLFDDDPKVLYWDSHPIMGKYDPKVYQVSPLIISIGNNLIRKRISESISHSFGKVIHPSAILDRTLAIGEGTVIFHSAIIQRGSKIGKHVIVNTGATIDHDCFVSDYAHISPNATLCGNVHIGEGTHVGAGAVVIQGIKIGKEVIVGAGSVVIRDIPDYAIVAGNPTKRIK